MRWLHFILSHSIFISLCAVALCYQTYTLMHIKPNGFVVAFIFFSTLSSYNFYWLLSKYAFGKKISIPLFIKKNSSYLFLSMAAGAGMAGCLYFLPRLIGFVAIAIVLTLVYSLPIWPFKFAVLLRKTGFLKTTLLAFTWAYTTVIIPAASLLHTETMAVISLMIARFFFVALLCIIFDRRDMKLDKMLALHSLATDVSRRTLQIIMMLVFVLYIAAGLLVRYHFNDNAQLIAFLITGLMVGWVYRASFKKQDYLFYYFLVDGMMLFSAAATFVASVI